MQAAAKLRVSLKPIYANEKNKADRRHRVSQSICRSEPIQTFPHLKGSKMQKSKVWRTDMQWNRSVKSGINKIIWY